MPKPSRSRNAVRRASFGRAERLQREAAARAKDAPAEDKAVPAPKPERPRAARAARPVPALSRAAAHERKLTALETVRQRIIDADQAHEQKRLKHQQAKNRPVFNETSNRRQDHNRRAEQERIRRHGEAARQRADDHRRSQARKSTQRNIEQTRALFNEKADRRQDHGRRAEQERVRQHGEAARKKADDHRRGAARKVLDRKRDQVLSAFNKEADRRRDAARRLMFDRARQRAAAEVEREQKRQREDQQAAQRREREEKQTARRIKAAGFRTTAEHAAREHVAEIEVLHEREDRELTKFEAERRGLVGWLAERVPGRRAANDRKEAEIKERYQAEREAKHRDHAAAAERRNANEQKARIGYFQELKAMQEAHRSGRATLDREQSEARPGLTESRARVIERTEREYQQEREHVRADHPRENGRPSGSFGRAA